MLLYLYSKLKPLKGILTQVSTIGAGHSILWVINSLFDYVLYALVLSFAGLLWGFGIMVVLSIILNLALIKVYDSTGKDWLGAESLQEAKRVLGENRPKWLRKILRSSYRLAYIFLSFYDPFIALIYLRRKEKAHKGMSRRDWKIFITSTILANVAWSVAIFTGLSVSQWIFKTFYENRFYILILTIGFLYYIFKLKKKAI